jgi:hypothetical protein
VGHLDPPIGAAARGEGRGLRAKLREAGGEDLRKIEVATKLEIGKLKRGFQEVADNPHWHEMA